MQEYKFLALPHSLKKSILFLVSLLILSFSLIILFFLTKGNLIVSILLVLSLCSFLFYNLLASKYVKIKASYDCIEIYYFGKLKYKASIDELVELRGVDIDKKYNRSELHLVFKNRSFVYNLWDSSLQKTNKQTRILRDLVEKYQLRKVLYKRIFPRFNYTYRYINDKKKIKNR